MPVYTQQPWGVAWGKVGYTANTANTTATTSDVTIASVTFTAVAGRAYLVTGFAANVSSSVAADVAIIKLKESSTILQHSYRDCRAASGLGNGFPIEYYVAPSAGSHTYDFTVIRGSGTGTITASGQSTLPAFLLVQDIGPA